MKLSFSIALRFLRSNVLQTIIIILGIGIGVSVQIFIGSLIQGLQNSLVNSTIGNSSQITITASADNELLEDYTTLMQKAIDGGDSIINISPVLDNPAFLESGGASQSVVVRGFDRQKAEGIYKFSEYITEGAFPMNNGEVMLGTAIKDKYGLKIDDTISLITADKRTVVCRVSGFFDFKVAALNGSWCVTTIASAQEIFSIGDKVSAIEMQVASSEIFNADIIAENLRERLDNQGLRITDWKGQNEQLLSGLQGQSISSLMIQVFVMISVVLGIASVLAITVMQKSRQIGILKAMGIKSRQASLIFLSEGLMLGVFGALAGIAIGIGLSASFTAFALNPDGTPVIALYINSSFIMVSGLIAVLACLIAAMIPARRSSKLDPIDIIRNN
ncbi:MAG: ABC transporter permease [Firmicutes bacterium HGW-Firmicutes-21]|nr:MAG: ABC transporter permease [Firmicutes bacterium HGW-Firmicutes-21]